MFKFFQKNGLILVRKISYTHLTNQFVENENTFSEKSFFSIKKKNIYNCLKKPDLD